MALHKRTMIKWITGGSHLITDRARLGIKLLGLWVIVAERVPSIHNPPVTSLAEPYTLFRPRYRRSSN